MSTRKTRSYSKLFNDPVREIRSYVISNLCTNTSISNRAKFDSGISHPNQGEFAASNIINGVQIGRRREHQIDAVISEIKHSRIA